MKLVNDGLVDHIGAMMALEGEKWRDSMRAGFAAYDRGNRIDGARFRPLPLYANQVAWGGPGRLVGWSLRAVGGTATVELLDGHNATDGGDVFASFDLSNTVPGTPAWFGPSGISFTEALFVVVTLGTATAVKGGLYLGAVD